MPGVKSNISFPGLHTGRETICQLKYLRSEFVAAAEEVDGVELLAHLFFLFVGHVAERHSVGTEVESDELHDAFSAHDVATVAADHVDHLLREVLMLAGGFDVTVVPSFDDGVEFAAGSK